jgi:hypothetical protein
VEQDTAIVEAAMAVEQDTGIVEAAMS